MISEPKKRSVIRYVSKDWPKKLKTYNTLLFIHKTRYPDSKTVRITIEEEI